MASSSALDTLRVQGRGLSALVVVLLSACTGLNCTFQQRSRKEPPLADGLHVVTTCPSFLLKRPDHCVDNSALSPHQTNTYTQSGEGEINLATRALLRGRLRHELA